jgi:hypothetical protein
MDSCSQHALNSQGKNTIMVSEVSCLQTKSKGKLWAGFIPYATLEKVRLDLFSGFSSKSSCVPSKNANVRNETAAETKRKWRRDQISSLRTLNCAVNSSWRNRQISFLWSGLLQKKSSCIVSRWQARWFELRQEPVSSCSASGNRAVLQYSGRGVDGGEELKRLEIIDVRRDCGHDGMGRACLSVKVVGRSGRVLLGSGSDGEAASLISCIKYILRPPAAEEHFGK